MADIETTLKTRTNQDNVFPNIHTANIPDGGVTTNKIANGGVTSIKIGTSAVQATHISPGAVTNPKIDDGAVTTSKILDANVTTAKLADNAVTTAKIASEAVDTGQIADGSINEWKLADNCVVNEKIHAGAVQWFQLDETHMALDSLEVYAGSWEQYVEVIGKAIRDYRCRFSYVYSSGGKSYVVSPSSISVCDASGTPSDISIVFRFVLHDGTSKTVTWAPNEAEPDEVSYIYVSYPYGLVEDWFE